MKIEEIRIPAPWGHIAAKAWGSFRDEAVLLWHGLLDSAGTFDNLIPLLPQNFYYICVDLPGHGQSSNFDHMLSIITTDYILAIKIVCNYFNRGQYIIVAHSLSTSITILFAKFYPEHVKKLMCLDVVSLLPFYPDFFAKMTLKQHRLLLNLLPKIKEKKKPLTYRESVQRFIDARSHEEFKWEHAEPMVRRMVKKIDEDQYIFTFDKRARSFVNNLPTFQYIIEMYESSPFQCPVVILLTTGFDMQNAFKPVYKYLKKAKNVTMHIIEGHHDIHNTNPEMVTGYITKFLIEDIKNKL